VPNTPPLGKSNHILIAPLRRIRFSFAVLKLRPFLKYWLPVLILLALIFSASADSHSYEHTSLLVEPFLHWLFPKMSEAHVKAIHHLIRKSGHLTEYAVLALLLWRAIRRPVKKDPRPWIWPEAGLALAIVFLVAASDEFHQIFVSTRTALVSDVVIDTVGGAAALLALWIFGRWRKRW
jgi:VanZ family protein